jgi:hypothetical protein
LKDSITDIQRGGSFITAERGGKMKRKGKKEHEEYVNSPLCDDALEKAVGGVQFDENGFPIISYDGLDFDVSNPNAKIEKGGGLSSIKRIKR